MENPAAPIRVFVSYAHEDRRWFQVEDTFGLVPWLAMSLRKQEVEFWFDNELIPSDVFARRIAEEIDRAAGSFNLPP